MVTEVQVGRHGHAKVAYGMDSGQRISVDVVVRGRRWVLLPDERCTFRGRERHVIVPAPFCDSIDTCLEGGSFSGSSGRRIDLDIISVDKMSDSFGEVVSDIKDEDHVEKGREGPPLGDPRRDCSGGREFVVDLHLEGAVLEESADPGCGLLVETETCQLVAQERVVYSIKRGFQIEVNGVKVGVAVQKLGEILR